MKKLFLFTLLLCIAISASAQKWQYGVKAGMNISTETLPDYSYSPINKGFVVGFSLGALINYNINNRFAIEADLLYSHQGCREIITYYVDFNGAALYRAGDYALGDCSHSHYIILPIAAKVNIFKGLYAECGPQIGYLCEKTFQGNSMLDSQNKIDFSLLAGIGYKITKNIFVDARYVHGLTCTYKNYGGAHNRNIMITAGYYL